MPETVLGKAVIILRAFTLEDRELSLADLTRRTGLHKATAHRLCREMVQHRLLDRVEGGYRLSGGLFELGMRASQERSLSEVAIPYVQDLYERTRETVHLGVREGLEVVYVLKIGGHRQPTSPSRLGGRMPLHCTAIGKALLAEGPPDLLAEILSGPLERRTPFTITAPGLLRRGLLETAERGVAYEREESALGITCVASAVHDEQGRPVAAISIMGRTARFRPELHATALRAAASSMSSTLARRSEARG